MQNNFHFIGTLLGLDDQLVVHGDLHATLSDEDEVKQPPSCMSSKRANIDSNDTSSIGSNDTIGSNCSIGSKCKSNNGKSSMINNDSNGDTG